MARQGVAERAGLEAGLAAVREYDARLRRAVAVVDRKTPSLLEHRGHLRIELVAGRDEPPELRRLDARDLAQLGERRILGGSLAEHRDAQPVDEVEPLERLERPVVQ